jgi:hypothetical protein
MKHVFTLSRPAIGVFLMLWSGLVGVMGAEVPAVTPEISVSLRGVFDRTVEVGEPLRVAVGVALPEESAATITLAPANGSWIDATAVEILVSDGDRVVGTAQPVVRQTESTTVLDQENGANGVWWFPAKVMTLLRPGDYLVRAKLSIHDGTGWKGECVSESAQLRVVATSNDPERVTQRVLSRAHAAVLDHAPAKAAGILDEVLAVDPDNMPVLKLRAAICLLGGDVASAHACITRARTLETRLGGEPSVELHELARRIDEAANEVSPAAEVPAWALPPRSVFYPVRPIVSKSSQRTNDTPVVSVDSKPAGTLLTAVHAEGIAKSTDAPKVIPTTGVVVPAGELIDAKITSDPAEQWAESATAGTKYGKTQYSPAQATGAPNISTAGNSPDAWCPEKKNVGTDWLELTFAKPVHATEVRVRQNDAAGAITKIEAIESDGTAHVWWEGVDPYVAPAVREIAWFAVRVPRTPYLVANVKITLNLASGPGWKEIDAVQLVGATQ